MLTSNFLLAPGLLPVPPACLLQARKGARPSASRDPVCIHAQGAAWSPGGPSLLPSASSGGWRNGVEKRAVEAFKAEGKHHGATAKGQGRVGKRVS